MKKYLFIFLLSLVVFSCQEDVSEEVPLNNHQNPPPDDDGNGDSGLDLKIGVDNSNAMLGNPTNAKHDVASEDNYLMDKGFYVVSYNKSKAIPNWVSWYLSTTSLGGAERSDAFAADTELPTGWFRVTDGSYSGSGFSRGHNCPSADRTTTDAANKATFLMTNMIPQVQENNGGVWEQFETYIRNQVKAGNEAFIIMGNYGKGGNDATDTYKETIAGGAITVPKMIWKVVVIIPQGDNDLNRITTSARVIAINTPNIKTISGTWGSFRVSVDAIEAATGFDLLAQLPDNIETVVEANVDTGSTN